MSERPTFSPFWHRVRAMKPRLRPHVQITRQHYRGRRWHVVHDPASNQFYRLNPIAHEFVGMLDGSRTVEDTWKISLEKHGDEAPTQNEVIQLISQLYNANLLAVEASPETEQLLRRGRERLKQKIAQQAIGIMYFRIKLFNPDRYLSWLEPLLRPMIGPVGFLVWLAVCLVTLFQVVVPNFGTLTSNWENVLDPSNWGWMILVFIVTKAIHETGHGVICKRYGGQVPEFGLMLLVLFPAPYVDASSSWSMASKWRRIAVAAGGMLFELFVASIACWVWVFTRSDTGDQPLITQIAYNAIFTASVSTVLFNANPLMRFDGYYMLSDLLEVPNLMQRSMNQLKYFFQKHVYRMPNPTPPTTVPAETVILYIYGIGAMCYRIFLFFSITLYVMGKLFAIGLVLAVWTGAMWFILPVGKFVHWLGSSPNLVDRRARTIGLTVAMIVVAFVLVGVIPVQDRRRATGVVESMVRSGIYFGEDAFVTEVHHRPGDLVHAGDPIVTCDSPELRAMAALASLQLEEAEIKAREAESSSAAEAKVAVQRVATLESQVQYYDQQLARLVVAAPHDGYLVGRDPEMLLGAFVRKGDPLLEVVDTSEIRVVALLEQHEAAWHFDIGRERYAVEMRRHAVVDEIIEGEVVEVVEAGQHELPHASLGFGGGGHIETDPRDESGMFARQPQFVMRIVPHLATSTPRPGERVALRFTLPSRPVMSQFLDRMHKLIQGRVKI
ncbi:MAG: PqqD family peptide modification chaperone [Phycisphaerales bacterium]|nr:PqqD family peptide modification chaperone [Phycisphaerales bacterium]